MKTEVVKVKFTSEPPHKAGLYLTPNGEFLEAIWNKQFNQWSLTPYHHCTRAWNKETDKRSTVCFEF